MEGLGGGGGGGIGGIGGLGGGIGEKPATDATAMTQNIGRCLMA